MLIIIPAYIQLVQPEELIAALEWMPAEAVESMTSVVLQDWPNTYTYTKQMAEYFVQKEVWTCLLLGFFKYPKTI
jgi:hypothetical protein